MSLSNWGEQIENGRASSAPIPERKHSLFLLDDCGFDKEPQYSLRMKPLAAKLHVPVPLPVSRNKNIWEGLRYNKLRAEAHMMMKAQFVLGGSRYRYDCRYGYGL